MGSDKKSIVKPLKKPVNAASHTAVYKMHRYYARRPWNVFEHIIKHYSKEGDIILDPFCGGGVTVVEGLKLKRKVIGVDLNPLATYITRMEVEPLDVTKFKTTFDEIIKIIEKEVLPLYKTKCNECKNDAIANWYEWSNVFRCPMCGKIVTITKVKKVSAGRYLCNNCNYEFKPSKSEKIGEEIIKKYIKCQSCKKEYIQNITEEDIKYFKEIEKSFEKTIKKEKLWYPLDEFPDGDRERDDALSQKGIKYFYNLFSKRNIIANARIMKFVKNFKSDKNIIDFLYLCFSGSLRFTNKMVFRNPGWQAGKPIEWAGHAYWVPDIFCELNAYDAFINRFGAIYRGKIFSNDNISNYYEKANNFNDLLEDKTCLILTQSSHDLQIPNNTVDVVITDPPFGGNVQYAELSDFWMVWLQNYLNTNGVIDNSLEAIQTRHTGFETAKDETHYENMLYRIFKECHRVLKKDGYMVLTFHNKDIDVWMSLHRAANRAGFRLPTEEESENRGILYQPPIQNYTQTFHTKAIGSMLGDFILSFKRLDILTDANKIKTELSKEQEIKLINKISELIEFHGGADDNTIMTTLIPTLNELGIFRQVSTFNWIDFISKNFEKDKTTNKWYRKTDFEEDSRTLRPIDYIPAEELSKELIINYLKEKRIATIDELLTEIYTKLVNSHRPGIEAINKVLNQYCNKVKISKKEKFGYSLKPERKTNKPAIEKITHQMGIFGGSKILNDLSHNDIILMLSNFAFERGFKVHGGETEQRKDPNIKLCSTDMLYKEDWGIASKKAFDKIKEIDLLILDGKEIKAAFEVTTSINTAREAINDRYRDLFTILPNTKINAYIIVNDEDFGKAVDMINSAANKKDKLSEKIKVIRKSNLTKDSFRKWIDR